MCMCVEEEGRGRAARRSTGCILKTRTHTSESGGKKCKSKCKYIRKREEENSIFSLFLEALDNIPEYKMKDAK